VRLLHLGNTANIGLHVVTVLRQAGVEASLLADRAAHIASQPSWEDPDLDAGQRPLWIKYFRNTARHRIRLRTLELPFPYFHRFQQVADVFRLAGEHDLLQAGDCDVILCLTQPRTPFVALCIGGDINTAALRNTPVGWLLRQSYRRARLVLYTNINMIPAVERLGLANAHYMPLPVDVGRYAPPPGSAGRSGDELILFSPTRHCWPVKGNDKLLVAFAEWLRSSGAPARLVLCEWGTDLDRSRGLVSRLGLRDAVAWHSLMPKGELIQQYLGADIVLDQFNLGAFGLTTLEAMACGRPVILNCSAKLAEACYPEPPPVCHAQTSEDIHGQLRRLEDPGERLHLGCRARQWITQHHSSAVVANRLVELYRQMGQMVPPPTDSAATPSWSGG